MSTKAKAKPAKPATKAAKPATKAAKSETEPAKPATKAAKVKREPIAEVEVEASKCPNCGSTDREGYQGCRARELSGTTAAGNVYNLVLWKPTKCRACGKRRTDVYHLNRTYRESDGDLLGVKPPPPRPKSVPKQKRKTSAA